MNRRERRMREKLLTKALKKNSVKQNQELLEDFTKSVFGKEFSEIMEEEKEELIKQREDKELKNTISNFMDALTVTEDNPDPNITIQCNKKGSIVLSLDRSKNDPRCNDITCITCRSYDVEEGLVDRHLLTEKEKQERDAKALEDQKLRDPEGYKDFLKSQAQDELAQDVDFEEIKDDE